jgi:hypothetical protein
MALPSGRSSGSAQSNNGAFARRVWEVQALLSTLDPQVRDALYEWLLSPTDPRHWPPPETFERRRWPIRADQMDGQRPTASRLLRKELRAIRQTLDLPPEAASRLTRNGLLTVHAIRLRQLERWLWPFYAAREIKRMITVYA